MVAGTLVAYAIGSFVLLLIGILIGWLYGSDDNSITEHQLRIGIAIVITMTWVVTIIAEILVPSYTVAMVIHAIMGAVVGYLFSENGISDILDSRSD